MCHHVGELLRLGLAPREIGVITPYNLQVETIRKQLQEEGHVGVEVMSVDGFQVQK